MTKITDDDKRWFEAWLDTPMGRPEGATSPQAAMKIPGCCVKSRGDALTDQKAGPLPQKFGVLVEFEDDRAVVRGHGSAASPRFLWEGSPREYLATWECD